VDRGGLEDQQVQQPGDLRRERTDALVVARLLGQIRKQVSKPPARPGQELPITGAVQQHLRDGQADQLGVSDPARAARTAPVDEELVSQDVESDQERVEAGGHDGHLYVVDGATEHRLLRQLP